MPKLLLKVTHTYILLSVDYAREKDRIKSIKRQKKIGDIFMQGFENNERRLAIYSSINLLVLT